MKKVIVILALAFLPLGALAQSVFDKFEDMDEVTTVVISENMFKLLRKIDVDTGDPEAQDFMDLAGSLTGLKVFTTEDENVGGQITAVANKYLKSGSMQELMRVKDKDANVKFYIKEGKDEDHVKELLMLVTDIPAKVKVEGRKIETVLLTLTGDIDLNKISSITNKMNLPEELNHADKKN
ncbi:DUF4252 domain-containing protein [Sediminicola luteus]|jgi:hypothetical protein|uniref:DUF4252 domain-containing protein n=1 Tax=Sediminicola luteus TaxID=319238 RepID=A0A2A4G3X9_9FLAO|nr:DUF4252 domain-containing protein [Sediminicola luteus]PCE62435.1 hypothetical protein B7P33_18960 [Sediminicola luteus]